MRDVLPAMKAWGIEGRRFALARVVETWGSAPRRPGAALVVSHSGEVAGSVSGGCIEGAVIHEAMACLDDGRRRFCRYGVDSETAWSVGLSCGGEISVLVQPFDSNSEVAKTWMDALERGARFEVLTGIHVPDEFLDLESTSGVTGLVERSGERYFVHAFTSPSRLVLIGGADIAVHLTALARRLDFRVIIVDPRAVFTNRERFDVQPDEVMTAWPQEVLPGLGLDGETYAVLLTHDPRIDDPALDILLRSDVRYIGALGGRKTQQARRARLLAAGFSDEQVSRVHGPVGLDIGAATPGEIALSILAEVVAAGRGAVIQGPRS